MAHFVTLFFFLLSFTPPFAAKWSAAGFHSMTSSLFLLAFEVDSALLPDEWSFCLLFFCAPRLLPSSDPMSNMRMPNSVYLNLICLTRSRQSAQKFPCWILVLTSLPLASCFSPVCADAAHILCVPTHHASGDLMNRKDACYER